MNEEIKKLNTRIEILEKMLDKRGFNFEELIRNTVFFDIDNSTLTTQTATDTRLDTVTIGRIPNYFIKAYIRGNVVLIPVIRPT